MPFQIVRDNIVHMRTDAIVNAANSALKAGGGVCGSIFDAAGREELQAACDNIGHCNAGGAVITKGFALKAKYIIHAVGPIWRDGKHGEELLLFSCYTAALRLAKEHGLSSIAFPLISSGIYGYPKDRALQVAVGAIGAFLLENDMDAYLVVYDRAAYQLSSKLFSSISSYIDDHYVNERTEFSRMRELTRDDLNQLDDITLCQAPPAAPSMAVTKRSLSDLLKQADESFAQSLFRLIDQKKRDDVEVYKRANIDRKLFSKIRNDAYKPGKRTILALCVALELSLDETRDLLAKAGYALSPSSRFDLIVRYFIEERQFDIFEINEALFAFDEPLLGA